MGDLMAAPRIYGAWAGNPAGHKEDPALCIESVHEPGRGGMIHQCYKKRGHGEGGLYCKIHDPSRVKAKRAASHNRYEAEYAVKDAERGVMVAAHEVYVSQVGAGWEMEQQRLAVAKLVRAYGELESARRTWAEVRTTKG